MGKILYLISLLSACAGVGAQTASKKALEYFNSGTSKISRKDYFGAFADLSEAIKLDSAFLQAYENRGVALYHLKNFRGAVSDYNKALEINPDDYNTFGRRGYAKFSLQDCIGAIDDFTKAIEGNRNDPRYYVARGRAKYQIHDYQGAMDDFNWVIKYWASGKYEKSRALYWRALVKIDLGLKKSACSDLERSVRLGYAMADEIKEMIFCP